MVHLGCFLSILSILAIYMAGQGSSEARSPFAKSQALVLSPTQNAALFGVKLTGDKHQLYSNSNPSIPTRDIVQIIRPQHGYDESQSFKRSLDWYAEYLSQQVEQSSTLISKNILNISTECTDSQPQPVAFVLRILKYVVSNIRGKRNIPLHEIVDTLDNSKYPHCQKDHDQGVTNQIVFAVIGWLTMLYSPHFHPIHSKRYLPSTPVTFGNFREIPIRSSTLDKVNQPFSSLLPAIAELIPSRANHDLKSYGHNGLSAIKSMPTNQFFYARLNNNALISIEWVETLSLHLMFNYRTRTLKMFRFPSFCRLMYSYGENSVFAGFMEESHKYLADVEKSKEPSKLCTKDAEEYFREVLLTYHLIFGQDKESRQLFNRKLPRWQKEWASLDPLLPEVCGTTDKEIYKAIKSRSLPIDHLARIDFPYFYQRLLEIQHFLESSKSMNSNLWRDRRDSRRWWTFWAVIISGSASIIFGIVQTVLQVWQLITVYQQISKPEITTTPEILLNLTDDDLALNHYEDIIPSRQRTVLWWLAFICITTLIPGFILSYAFCWLKSKRTVDRLRGTGRIARKTLISWQCNCGQDINDDFVENASTIQNQSVEYLDDTDKENVKKNSCTTVDIESQANDIISGRLKWISRLFSSSLSQRIIIESKEEVSPPTEPKVDHQNSDSDLAEPLFLLACIDRINNTPVLVQLDISNCPTDQELFSRLRQVYRARRGKWLEWLCFKSLRDINFVQFTLWGDGEVDIVDHADEKMLPALHDDEYCFDPRPATTLPPIGSNRLRHFFDRPAHADSKQYSCWSRLPKRKKERLHVDSSGSAVGWGIHLVEGPNLFLIWVLIVFLFLVGSFAFAIAYSVLDHDIQSGFAIASYVVSFVTLSIGGCSLCCGKMSRQERIQC